MSDGAAPRDDINEFFAWSSGSGLLFSDRIAAECNQ